MAKQNDNNDNGCSNEDHVLYCARCYSLKVIHEDSIDSDCCGECGCTSIEESSFEDWEELYRKRYGKKFIDKKGDWRSSPIYNLSFSKLMTKVSDSPKWEFIIKSIYGYVPKGFSKADTIVLFFDRLVRDNKLDSLKKLLYNMKI